MNSNIGVSRVGQVCREAGLEVLNTKPEQIASSVISQHPLGLTKRESQVLELIISGLTNQAIADKLNRSIRTIEHHVSAVLAKFNVENRVEVIVRIQSEPWLLMPSKATTMVAERLN